MFHTARVAVITGAARGIGAATAQRLARDGLAVAVLDLDDTAVKATADAIAETGGTVLAVAADVSNAAAAQAAVAAAAATVVKPRFVTVEGN